MKRAYLIDEQTGERAPVQDELVIGRGRDCDIRIDDGAASRRHVEITRRHDGAYMWRDLGSTNGTLLNGNAMLAGELRSGDCIQIGEKRLLFKVEDASEATVVQQKQEPLFQETLLKSDGQAERMRSAGHGTALLEAAYRVANEIANNYDPCALLDRILESTTRAVKAERGAVFLAGQGNELLPCSRCGKVHRIRDGLLEHVEHQAIQISRSVAQRVLEGGESVLFQNPEEEGGLAISESIVSLRLRSILCAPLRARRDVLGILYLDSSRPSHQFRHEDVMLASAVANSAGIALEHAQMHQDLLDKSRMEQEIATAWTIQEGFLVKEWPQDEPSYHVYGETRPAKTVGGDFYDFLQLDDGKIDILIGDVSGKGVPAALTMAQVLAGFRLHARQVDSPARTLALLNEELVKRSRRGLFCTLCHVRLDLKTGEAVCANAGHLPAAHVGLKEVQFIAPADGPPIGILDGELWRDQEFSLKPGEMLLLCTDGILEARYAAQEDESTASQRLQEYGEDSLRRCLKRAATTEPEAAVQAVLEDVQAFCAPDAPHDDCTLIAVEYRGAQG